MKSFLYCKTNKKLYICIETSTEISHKALMIKRYVNLAFDKSALRPEENLYSNIQIFKIVWFFELD